ncbi:family 10 glycosylhydrolase [Oscillatoria salina IIICB1]|nr:family 10 glycosylhydrolase [Oscillatoria salina IIICB1]
MTLINRTITKKVANTNLSQVEDKIGIKSKLIFSYLTKNSQHRNKNFGLSSQVSKIGFFFISWLLLFSFFPAPGKSAETGRLGVVRSPENAQQWQGIVSRLQATGFDYCVVELANLDEAEDLTGVGVLLIPNVETMTGEQVQALQSWVNLGGRTIASGPTGSLSQANVRSQLRSLLGAYWGFPLSSPATLDPLRTRQQIWVRKKNLSGTLRGGVVIPAGLNSSTAAVWQSDGTPPAVITTENSTFLGWRWGVDTASTAEIDAAWLEAAVGRYGSFTAASGKSLGACNGGSVAASEPSAINVIDTASLPPRQNRPNSNPTVNNSPPSTPRAALPPRNSQPQPSPPTSRGTPIAARQVVAMREELTSLIGRYESAILAADLTHKKLNLSTTEAVEQSEKSPQVKNPSTNQALEQARSGLQNFVQSIETQNYDRARSEWQQARRSLLDNYPVAAHGAEIRAMWLDRGTIVQAKSEQDLARIFDRMAAAGINTVFFETVNAGYPIYPSQVAPEQNPLTKGWDPLAAAIKLARSRGMELHAWVWIFATANQRHNPIIGQPINYPGPVLAARPDWAIRDNRGNLFHPNSKKAFLDPANSEARSYLLSLLEEIATKYDVDGIQFDYIRYPFQDPNNNQSHGYSQAANTLFKELSGVDPKSLSPRHSLWQKWTEFRIQQVDSFVATAFQRLRQKRPDLIISAAVFPIPKQERLNKIQQNWEEWANRGNIDIMVPMTYAENTEKLEEMTEPLYNPALLKSTLLLPGIRLLNLPDVVAIDQMQLLRNSPTGGYALFAAENLNNNLESQFRSSPKQQQPLPHREPFAAAASRYQALQQEWIFLLLNNNLAMSKSVMREWSQEVDKLAVTLDKLAAEPSAENLSAAKVALAAFRGNFSGWMESQAREKPYQVQVWSNRLASLERLLNYGERVVITVNSKQ